MTGDAHLSNRHLHYPELFFDTFHHSFLRNAASPCATASNSELAVTSAVCEVPSSSELEINPRRFGCSRHEGLQYEA